STLESYKQVHRIITLCMTVFQVLLIFTFILGWIIQLNQPILMKLIWGGIGIVTLPFYIWFHSNYTVLKIKKIHKKNCQTK
ncbi:MAG: hypothetical protein ACRCST_12865, partial [Turicibacter sp.]